MEKRFNNKGDVLLINGISCIVQSYKMDDFVNLSPIQSGKQSLADTLGNIRIDFVNRTILTDSKENAKWKSFVSALDIIEINNFLKQREMNKNNFLNKSLAEANEAYLNSVFKILDQVIPRIDSEFREKVAKGICKINNN